MTRHWGQPSRSPSQPGVGRGPHTGWGSLSRSSAEYFAGSLQSLGRATIVGDRTPGSCLVAAIVPLPHGGALMYQHCQAQTPDGTVLEGNGVVPDIPVALSRQESLNGIDAQLEAAIEQAS